MVVKLLEVELLLSCSRKHANVIICLTGMPTTNTPMDRLPCRALVSTISPLRFDLSSAKHCGVGLRPPGRCHVRSILLLWVGRASEFMAALVSSHNLFYISSVFRLFYVLVFV